MSRLQRDVISHFLRYDYPPFSKGRRNLLWVVFPVPVQGVANCHGVLARA